MASTEEHTYCHILDDVKYFQHIKVVTLRSKIS